MGKSHVFVFNSQYSLLSTVGCQFNVDWSRLDRSKRYKAMFTFLSANVIGLNAVVANIFMDLGSSTTQICSTNSTSYMSFYLGNIKPQQLVGTTGANTYYYAGITDNVPIWLDRPPSNNQVFIQIHTNSVEGMTNFTPAPPLYTLALYLEEQD